MSIFIYCFSGDLLESSFILLSYVVIDTWITHFLFFYKILQIFNFYKMFREAIIPTLSELISARRRSYQRSVSKVKEEQGRS